MSLFVNTKKEAKKGAKGPQNNTQASKFIAKPGKSSTSGGGANKPIKTGGTRGS